MNIVKNFAIYNFRPTDIRSEAEESVYDYLLNIGIDFQRIDHLPADTIQSCHEIEKYLNSKICKNLFLRNSAKTSFYLLLMDGEKSFISKDVSKKLSSTRLSFASEEDLYDYLKIKPGSVSIMGLINDSDCRVNLVIDKDLLNEEYFCCHPCVNTSTLKFTTKDIINKFIPATKHDFKIIEV